jgi:hypothetical protein
VITVGAMRLPQPEPLDDLSAFLRGLEPDGGYWLAMRRLSAHDHSGGVMGVPVAGGGGGGEIPPEYVTDAELATALGPYATDADLAGHVAAADPHPTYTTAAELSAAISAHAAAADPHAVYLTQTEGDARYALATALTALTTRVTALETSVAALKVHVHELGTFGAGTLAPTGGIP